MSCAIVLGLSVFAAAPAADSDDLDPEIRQEHGRQIYRAQCQRCHGAAGEGTEDFYPDPLVGDATIGELTDIISETMPEEDPEECVAEDAEAVAHFIHEAFYSEAAQLRNQPPEVQFSRLTSSQLRQSLADLYQHFYREPHRDSEQGLSGAYFDSNRWKKEKLKLERVDSVVDFDFGHQSPGEGIAKEEFYIHWTGSLQPAHTGRYELVVESTCSMKMRFGHDDRILIDNHVQSEGKTEFRRTLQLIGGRQYPIFVDFTQRKRKTEQPPAKFSLRWVPPGGIEQVIPPEYLRPSTGPNTFALQSKLPPDDRTYGYDRGTRVDRQWDEAVTSAALEFGEVAARELWPQYRRTHRKDSDENRGRLRGFLTELARVAFRTEPSQQVIQLYVNDQLDAADDDQLAIARACLMMIKSPRFLYPAAAIDSTPDDRISSSLALTLYDSLPSDQWLLSYSAKSWYRIGEKGLENRIRQAATRMSDDPRLEAKAMEMFFEWLHVDPTAEIAKNPETFEGFDVQLTLDLRRSLERSLQEVFWSDESDYRQLFRQTWNWTNPNLAHFYGDMFALKDSKSDDASSIVSLVPGQPAPEKVFGVLAHPLVMSHLSYYDTTSPIHRGVFLIRRVLGRTLRPPNVAFSPLNPELHPDLTTRERVELQTNEAMCQVCHQKINGLGFSLENFDSVGRYRDVEQGKPIDASGGYVTRAGDEVEFTSPAELAAFLAENEDAQRAFVERVFEHFAKQPPAAYGPDTADKLLESFRENQFHMRRLIAEVAVIVALDAIEGESENAAT
ncbi:MAG: DUF1588 domain-containing protein [Planctomycetota bacterium]